MPAPEVYTDERFDPFSRLDNPMQGPEHGILYATSRKPDLEGDSFYLNERGFNLRLGRAETEIGPGGSTWEEARRISLLKNRTDRYPVKVINTAEIGILNRTITVFTPPELIPEDPNAPSDRFAEMINTKLKISKKKDVFIYVHGYKVVFSNPILASAELWHFLGYEGVFIAFAWPSTPSRWAYFSDIETAELAAHNLRILIEYLGGETRAERLHLIGYSAGTRVVAMALHQLALIYANEEEATVSGKTRIGHVILVGSDVDRQLFGAYLVDGLLKTAQSTSVYVSSEDRALGLAKRLFRRKRLGQMWEGSMSPELVSYLKNSPRLKVINVTGIEGSATGNGHAYFRNSPWVSSDILMTLMHDLPPDERGLVRSPDRPVWLFPNDYIQRLRAASAKHL